MGLVAGMPLYIESDKDSKIDLLMAVRYSGEMI